MAAALQLAGGGINAMGAIMQGNATKKADDYEAGQLEDQGRAAMATASTQAAQQYRQGQLTLSSLQANAAANGSAGSPDAINAGASIDEDNEYRMQTQLWNGSEQQRFDNNAAIQKRKDGQQAKKASYINALSALVGAGGNAMTSKYGGAGASAGGAGASNGWFSTQAGADSAAASAGITWMG